MDQEPVFLFLFLFFKVHSEATFTGCWLCFGCFALLDPHLNVDMTGAHLLRCFLLVHILHPASASLTLSAV